MPRQVRIDALGALHHVIGEGSDISQARGSRGFSRPPGKAIGNWGLIDLCLGIDGRAFSSFVAYPESRRFAKHVASCSILGSHHFLGQLLCELFGGEALREA